MIRTKAFTLIELLVVIAIIAVLAAIMIPVISRARSAADSIGCRNNLHQLTLAINMYVHQEGVYPPDSALPKELWRFLGAPFPQNSWSNGANGVYLGPRHSVWACPGYNRIHGLLSFGPGIYIDGYAYNAWAFDWQGAGVQSRGLVSGYLETTTNVVFIPQRENQVLAPSDMIAIADAPLVPNPGLFPSAPMGTPGLDMGLESDYYAEIMYGRPANDPTVKAMGMRHGGRWNVGFCDGHVENLRAQNLFDLRADSVARRWNDDHQPHNENWQPPAPP